MIPLRLVVDTNILVSAALKPDGLQRTDPIAPTTHRGRWFFHIPCALPGPNVNSFAEQICFRSGLTGKFWQYRENPHGKLVYSVTCWDVIQHLSPGPSPFWF
jgi:hypothetical protein